VTGSDVKGLKPALELVAALRSMTDLPLALGFGIRSRDMVQGLGGRVDIAVIGSHLLGLYQSAGLGGMARFLEELR
jgi:tryptophan synthase alpha chain